MEHGVIVLYKTAQEAGLKLEVRVVDETVWLTQQQIADLFGTQRPAITKHLKNIYKSGELDESSTCSILEHMGAGGTQKYKTRYYSLDAILSVGYRVNSKNATHFRMWANKILKEYLLRGHVFNHRFEKIERKLFEHDQKFELIIKTGLKPSEGIFYDGQIFDAWEFVSKLVKSARHSITLIDNYIDESVLGLLAKRAPQVKASIYSAKTDKRLKLDLQRHNKQYPPVQIHTFSRAHDRFLIIDEETVYHIGASLKDLGKKWFAFSRMQLDANEMIERLK